VMLWCPLQHRADVVGSCDDLCWMAGSARCDLDLEVDARNVFDPAVLLRLQVAE